jgi:hypothetical protein
MHPHLKEVGDTSQLYVNDSPFLILGAELHNSTASNLKFLRPILPRLVSYNINTVFLPISWELIEPEEGVFDFTLVDEIINCSKSHGLRLVLLWFGSFKNGESSYVPEWVKKNPSRFPRSVTLKEGKLVTTKTLSVFAKNNVDADAKAFKSMMQHIHDFDKDSVVVMVQVENEPGVLWDSRDRSDLAETQFKRPVPDQLLSFLKKTECSLAFTTRFPELGSGTWESVFGAGESADELFMAWHYARYIDSVAQAGKEAYDIPLYINAALNIAESVPRKLWKHPGQYPSGGVLPHTMDIYRAGSSYIDMFSPDIYADEFEEFCDAYRHGNNPLLIPETRRDYYAAERMFYAYGSCKAIGVSPFGIDTIWDESVLYKSHFAILKQVSSQILKAQAEDKIVGFHFTDAAVTRPVVHSFGSITAHIERIHSYGKPQSGFGLIMETADNEFLGVGFGYTVHFSSESRKRVEIMSISEGHFPSGAWEETRKLNGDETASNSRWQFASVSPDYGDYHVPLCYPANTGISLCRVFCHENIYGVFP